MNNRYLKQLGVYGYDEVEPVILAALVSGDPLLLIGRAGTGKTFLLNSLSEALGLEHRHYNASLIAFDDLVGFPWPEASGTGIRYIETPATVWGAESVLVDEINRCKPEHQNRLFSLVHERRIQGLRLEKLRYRWAAMNPAGFDQDGESYAGCEPLDAALADRFAFLVNVADWPELGEKDRALVADPRGEGLVSKDGCGLSEFLVEAGKKFAGKLAAPDQLVLGYCCHAATSLGASGLRISPRRVRQLVRNILALESVSGLPRERLLRLALQWSLPQRSGLTAPDDAVIHGAHRAAWEAVCSEGVERWLYGFHSEPDLAKKISLLLESCDCPDTGAIAVSQLIASETLERGTIFCYSVYPALVAHPSPPVAAEAIQDLGRFVNEMLEIDRQVTWRDTNRSPLHPPGGGRYEGIHPNYGPARKVLQNLRGNRRKRAEQLFLFLLSRGEMTSDPQGTEKLLHRCVEVCRKFHGTSSK